jgi:AraC family transcriptional regulator
MKPALEDSTPAAGVLSATITAAAPELGARPTRSILLGEWREDLRFDVRAQAHTPTANVELHDIHFAAPHKVDSRNDYGFIDFALNHRAGEPVAWFPDVRGHRQRRVGDIMFVPAHTRLRSTWSGSLQRSVCVLFEGGGHLERDWSARELDAALDLRDGALRETMGRLAHELENPGFESGLMIESLCIQIAIILRRHLDGAGGSADRGGGLVAVQLRRVEELLDCAGHAPSLTELAAECGLSPRHFCRLFRAATGRSLTEFAIGRRIERARTLLSEGRMPIKQVAWACGFATPAAFSAAFRRATGHQPSQYRQLRCN